MSSCPHALHPLICSALSYLTKNSRQSLVCNMTCVVIKKNWKIKHRIYFIIDWPVLLWTNCFLNLHWWFPNTCCFKIHSWGKSRRIQFQYYVMGTEIVESLYNMQLTLVLWDQTAVQKGDFCPAEYWDYSWIFPSYSVCVRLYFGTSIQGKCCTTTKLSLTLTKRNELKRWSCWKKM